MTDPDRRDGQGFAVILGIVLVAISALLFATGCTMITFNAETKDIKYTSILQKKSLDIGRDASGNTTIRYSTDSDAAVKLAEMNIMLAEKLAAAGMRP